MIDVEVDGVHYQEMHVDGGAMAQVFLYPPSLNLASALDNSRQDQTLNTPALATLILLAAQLTAVLVAARVYRRREDGALVALGMFGNPTYWALPVATATIGAHAAVAGHRLLTRDDARYSFYFPSVPLLTPATHPTRPMGSS